MEILPMFDNVILSKISWEEMKDKKTTEKPPSLLGCVNVLTSEHVPSNMILLRQGQKIVAIIKIAEPSAQPIIDGLP